jgi:molecular chaperone DnaK
VTVHVLQGEREVASANKSLGRFDLSDIPPAPRGLPQIEVTFNIDANGILHVSAKDKATGKEQSIQIKASSGLSDDEIDRMVKDAEAHASEDRKFHELVDVRNQADGLIHATSKSLKELGDKVEAGEKQEIEAAIEALQTAMKGDDKDEIVSRTQALGEKSGKLAERVYKESAAQQDAGGEAGTTEAGGKAQEEDVVDAEFEEVKDSDSK